MADRLWFLSTMLGFAWLCIWSALGSNGTRRGWWPFAMSEVRPSKSGAQPAMNTPAPAGRGGFRPVDQSHQSRRAVERPRNSDRSLIPPSEDELHPTPVAPCRREARQTRAARKLSAWQTGSADRLRGQ